MNKLVAILFLILVPFIVDAQCVDDSAFVHVQDSIIVKVQDVVAQSINNDADITICSNSTDGVNDLIDFLKSTWGTLNFWIILVILCINLVVSIVQLSVPFGQNRREKKLIEHKFKISKKHEYIEMIHINMCGTINSLFFDDRVIKINKLIDIKSHSGLYIDDDMKSIIEKFIESAEMCDDSKCTEYLKEFEMLYKR